MPVLPRLVGALVLAAVLVVAFPLEAESATGPGARVVRHPATTTSLTTATFIWRPAGSTARCRLDRRRWRACRSPTRYRGLVPGRHRFSVRLTARGRVVGFAWTVQGAAPAPGPPARPDRGVAT